MQTYKKSLIALIILLTLTACGDENGDSNGYEYGVLKSEPPMPPLTYTWSHPDCPFTVNFPGEPEVEVINQKNKHLKLLVSDGHYIYQFLCFHNNLKNDQETDSFTNQELLFSLKQGIQNLESSVSIIDQKNKFQIFSHLKDLNSIYFLSLYQENKLLQNIYAIYETDVGVGMAITSYPNKKFNINNGIEFIESIKVKQ